MRGLNKIATLGRLLKRYGPVKAFRIFRDIYFFDIRYGIETRREMLQSTMDIDNRNSTYYAPVYPSAFRWAQGVIDPDCTNGTFVDFGCGKGRALVLAAKAGFRRCIGVELSEALSRQCRQNMDKLALDSISVANQDAQQFDIPADTTVFFFYNPFDAGVLETVLHNILALERRAKETAVHPARYIIYVNPVHDAVFQNSPRLELVGSSRVSQPTHVYRIRA